LENYGVHLRGQYQFPQPPKKSNRTARQVA
jgi:hypothetical protein